MTKKIRTIFVIGTERSGTKWLTRIIASHDEVAAVINDYDEIEEAYFENFDFHFPDVKRIDDYIAMVELFSKTYVSRLINCDKEILYHLDTEKRPHNYFGLFKFMMDNYTKKNNKRYWVQKASPKVLPKLIRYFPDAIFVVIRRKFIDNIKSRVANRLKTRPNSKRILTMVYQYVYQEKITKRNLRNKRVLFVKYEDLKNNTTNTLKLVSEYIKIDIKESQYTKPKENQSHSSFRSNKQRNLILTKSDLFFARMSYYIFKTVPLFIYDFLYKNISKSRYMMVAGTFTPTMLKYKLSYKTFNLDHILKNKMHD